MFVKQLSVFIENREGRLEQVTDVIRQENINILSLSMAENPFSLRAILEGGMELYSNEEMCR